MNKVQGQFIRYFFAAGSIFLLDLVLFYLFVKVLGANYLLINTVIFIAGSLTNYVVSYKWVFPDADLRSHKRNLAALTVVIVSGILVSNLILLVTIEQFGLEEMLSKIIAVGAVFGWNFVGRKFLVFRC